MLRGETKRMERLAGGKWVLVCAPWAMNECSCKMNALGKGPL